jgi:LysR family nitrogen assimilation transcriptional regulator
MDMDLRQLRYFVHIVEMQSFSKAAAFLRITQPALSRQIMLLEDELGEELLTRHGWGASATPVGLLLADHARRLLKDAQLAKDSVRAFADEPSGNVSFGVPSSLGAVLLPDVARLFRSRYPKVRLHLVEGFSATIHEWSLHGRLNLAVLYEAPAMPQLSVLPLIEEAMVAVGAVDRFRDGSRIAVQSLLELPLILPARPHRLRLLVDGFADALGGTPIAPLLEVDSLPVLLELVRAGMGCTVLPYSAVDGMLRLRELSVAQIVGTPTLRRLVIARPTGRPIAPATVALEHAVVEFVHSNAARLRWTPLAERPGGDQS